MRRRTLLTVALCMVLATASQSVGSGYQYVKAESNEESVSTIDSDDNSGKAAKETSKPKETPAPTEEQPPAEPKAPAETQTSAPETQPPTEAQTSAPETQPPAETQTSAPETQPPTEAQASAPETQPPAETQTSAPETQAPTEAQTSAPETSAPVETQAPTETQPPTEAQTSVPETQPPTETQTSAPETQPPTETQTGAPETQPPTETQTSAPETQPPTETQTSAPETQPPSEAQTNASDSENAGEQENTGNSGDTGESDLTDPDANSDTEEQQTETSGETISTEQPSTETSPTETAPDETESEDETSEAPETEKKKKTETETENNITNEELVSRQQIVIPPKVEKEFRFTKVEKQYAIVRNPEGTQVYEEKSTDARAVGALNYYGCCYILEDQEDDWYYIESGNVRGFVRKEEVVTGEVADRIARIKGVENLPSARLLVARQDNAAFTYTHTTVQEVMASPEYALAAGEVKIYEQKKDSARVIGTMSENNLCYILDETDHTWVFVESDDARGFVEKKDLIVGQTAANAVSEAGEENMPLAEVLVKPEDNKACYYTLTSVKEASQEARTREAMVNFAMQFLGNPYVWGGTSLTHGADCSGFVQSIYSYFGYSLPRVAEDQARYGTQIPIESAEPGDLIFYARNGYVYHVSMYIGDGQVIQAAGKRVGIITSGIGGNAVWATRVISG